MYSQTLLHPPLCQVPLLPLKWLLILPGDWGIMRGAGPGLAGGRRSKGQAWLRPKGAFPGLERPYPILASHPVAWDLSFSADDLIRPETPESCRLMRLPTLSQNLRHRRVQWFFWFCCRSEGGRDRDCQEPRDWRITFRDTSDELILIYLWYGLLWVGVGMVEGVERRRWMKS